MLMCRASMSLRTKAGGAPSHVRREDRRGLAQSHAPPRLAIGCDVSLVHAFQLCLAQKFVYLPAFLGVEDVKVPRKVDDIAQSFPGSQPFSRREQFAGLRHAWEKDPLGKVGSRTPLHPHSVCPGDRAPVNAAQLAKFDVPFRQFGGCAASERTIVGGGEPFAGDAASAFEPAELPDGPHVAEFDGCR